ncbi:hypothetical protein QOZ80_5AG0367070 [Eleusine coracana subsp. coracana]|nr:hypothetical protein QOZ80_5AG0367070 [Eleusine coracana subsp. coracana]
MSMEQSGGDVAAKRVKASDDDASAGGEDCLSALPDDVLVLILLCLYIKDAVRTSVLSRRWRRVWTLLPVLRFGVVRDSRYLSSALSASEVPLRNLHVGDPNAFPESLAAWLPTAARRVSGRLVLVNFVPKRRAADGEMEESQRGTFELPCFETATSICLRLGFLVLSVPPAGVFARLTELSLSDVRFHFHGPGDLGDVVSSPRCPCLQKLSIHNVRGLDSITINSESLQLLDLKNLRGVRQVSIAAPALKDLTLMCSFLPDQKLPAVNISAPQLKSLKWAHPYDPSSIHLGSMEHLQTLSTFCFVYGDGFKDNRACLMLLSQFKAIENLILSLGYLPYLMEDMTMLPDVTSLELIVASNGHAIGACSFHVLRICSGIKQLMLTLSSMLNLEVKLLLGVDV